MSSHDPMMSRHVSEGLLLTLSCRGGIRAARRRARAWGGVAPAGGAGLPPGHSGSDTESAGQPRRAASVRRVLGRCRGTRGPAQAGERGCRRDHVSVIIVPNPSHVNKSPCHGSSCCQCIQAVTDPQEHKLRRERPGLRAASTTHQIVLRVAPLRAMPWTVDVSASKRHFRR